LDNDAEAGGDIEQVRLVLKHNLDFG